MRSRLLAYRLAVCLGVLLGRSEVRADEHEMSLFEKLKEEFGKVRRTEVDAPPGDRAGEGDGGSERPHVEPVAESAQASVAGDMRAAADGRSDALQDNTEELE